LLETDVIGEAALVVPAEAELIEIAENKTQHPE
jgi:hypothetical protein